MIPASGGLTLGQHRGGASACSSLGAWWSNTKDASGSSPGKGRIRSTSSCRSRKKENEELHCDGLRREDLPEPPTQLLKSAIDHPSRQTEMRPAEVPDAMSDARLKDPAGSARPMDCPAGDQVPGCG